MAVGLNSGAFLFVKDRRAMFFFVEKILLEPNNQQWVSPNGNFTNSIFKKVIVYIHHFWEFEAFALDDGLR